MVRFRFILLRTCLIPKSWWVFFVDYRTHQFGVFHPPRWTLRRVPHRHHSYTSSTGSGPTHQFPCTKKTGMWEVRVRTKLLATCTGIVEQSSKSVLTFLKNSSKRLIIMLTINVLSVSRFSSGSRPVLRTSESAFLSNIGNLEFMTLWSCWAMHPLYMVCLTCLSLIPIWILASEKRKEGEEKGQKVCQAQNSNCYRWHVHGRNVKRAGEYWCGIKVAIHT